MPLLKDQISTLPKDFVFQESSEPLPDFETFNLPLNRYTHVGSPGKYILYQCLRHGDLKKTLQTAGFTDGLAEDIYNGTEMDEILKNIWLTYPQIIRQETKKVFLTALEKDNRLSVPPAFLAFFLEIFGFQETYLSKDGTPINFVRSLSNEVDPWLTLVPIGGIGY